MLNAQSTQNSQLISQEWTRTAQVEESAAVERMPIQLSRSLIEFLYSLLVGTGAFLLFFSFGYWMFADASPETGQIGGLILGSVMGLLFFVFAWGYYGQRQRWSR